MHVHNKITENKLEHGSVCVGGLCYWRGDGLGLENRGDRRIGQEEQGVSKEEGGGHGAAGPVQEGSAGPARSPGSGWLVGIGGHSQGLWCLRSLAD